MAEKEHEFVSEAEITITGIEAQKNTSNSAEVKKVIFSTDKGKITFKPKETTEEFVDGIKVTGVVPAKLVSIPDKIKEIASEVQKKGKAIVKASYRIWNTETDGKPVTYKFIQGSKMLDEWKIVSEGLVT